MAKVKTGECYFRDEAGDLYLSESFEDENGVVDSENHKIDESGVSKDETTS